MQYLHFANETFVIDPDHKNIGNLRFKKKCFFHKVL